MPVADTELLFMLNPKDPRHRKALNILEKFKGKLYVPDTALFEFETVLRSRGRSEEEIKHALLALKKIFDEYSISEASTVNLVLLVKHLELMLNYGLTFFDSLIASSALSLDSLIVSDDKAYDNIKELKRIPITQ